MKIILILILNISLFADGYVIAISNSSKVDKVSKRILKDLYLKKRVFIDDNEIVPINLPPQSELRVDFEEEVLGMDREEINDFWINQHYQGITPPIVQRSPKGLKLFIKNVDGAIGYIKKDDLSEELKSIYEF